MPGEIPDREATIIRPAAMADEYGVLRLWKEAFGGDQRDEVLLQNFRRKLQCQPDLFLLGLRAGQVVAGALAGYDGHRGHVHAVAVLANCRRQGLGRRLFEEIVRRLHGYGCTKLNLLVDPANSAALRFYESLGFRSSNDLCMSLGLEKSTAAPVVAGDFPLVLHEPAKESQR